MSRPRGALERLWSWFRGESRTSLKDPALVEMFGGRSSASGVSVTPDSALNCVTVLACVRIIAETVSSLPLRMYERVDGGRRPADDHPLYDILHDEPNPWMTSCSFWESMVAALLLRGNAYAEKVYGGGGQVLELWPILPQYVTPKISDASIVYEVQGAQGQATSLSSDRVLHIHGLGSDGLLGYSPITLARDAVGLALAAEEYGARTFSNDATPGGILTHPGQLSAEAAKRLKQSWEDAHRGSGKARRTALLEEGMSWVRIGMPNDDAQFLETRRFQVQEVARLFRVPLHMLADLVNASYSSIEQQGIDFVSQTIRPWCVRIEREIRRQLIPREDRRRYYAEFALEGLLRGDTASRYSAYATGRQNGWLSIDEIRALENMNPLPDGLGASYMVPMNMTQLGMEPEGGSPGGVPLVAKGDPEDA